MGSSRRRGFNRYSQRHSGNLWRFRNSAWVYGRSFVQHTAPHRIAATDERRLTSMMNRCVCSVWASLDGGWSWLLLMPHGRDLSARTQVSLGLDANEQRIYGGQEFLYILSGQSADGREKRDVYRSSAPLSDAVRVTIAANRSLDTLSGGVGLICYPSSTSGAPCLSPAMKYAQFVMMTYQAPWSGRRQAAFQTIATPLTYRTWDNSQTMTASPTNAFIVYGGTQYAQNDVWVSTSNGRYWTLISGIARTEVGANVTQSALPTSSYTPRYGGATCEDRNNDYAYIIGGLCQRRRVNRRLHRGRLAHDQQFAVDERLHRQ